MQSTERVERSSGSLQREKMEEGEEEEERDGRGGEIGGGSSDPASDFLTKTNMQGAAIIHNRFFF